MTKSQLLQTLSDKLNMQKKDIKNFIDVFTQVAYTETKRNGEFTWPGVGKLVKQNRKARIGRNPATGQEIKIPAKTVLKFRVSKAAKDEIL